MNESNFKKIKMVLWVIYIRIPTAASPELKSARVVFMHLNVIKKKGAIKVNKVLKQILPVCVCLFALTGQAIADALSNEQRAYDRGNYAEAINLLRRLAAQGQAEVQYNLGAIHDNYIGVNKDYKEALKWYCLAADQGYGEVK